MDDIQIILASQPFDPVRKAIGFEYGITNNGGKSYAGPIEVIHDTTQINCPAINQVGNKDDKFDENESMRCEGAYNLTQADFDAGGVISRAQVSLEAGTFLSRELVTELPLTQNRKLTLKTITDPPNYDRVGQTITITYKIMNNGTVTLGPAQFVINDNLTGAPLNCGPAGSSLAPTESVICSASYTINQSDLDSGSVTSDATASDGTISSDTTIVKVTKSIDSKPPTSGLAPGSTIQHSVIPGDWLMQIARCYGAEYESVRRANPHIYTPGLIWSGQVVSVPNIGNVGTIYGPPCVVFHAAVAGDTWESLGANYNARLDVLREVNPGGLYVGANIKVPINSAGGNSTQVPISKRINIPFGSTSATETGSLTPLGKATYLVSGKTGKTMTVTLTAPVGEVAMGIYDPNGVMLLNPADLALAWTGGLPADGDYRIELASAAGIIDKNYSLNVELTTLIGTLERVADIHNGIDSSNPSYLAVYNGVLYYGARDDGSSPNKLWMYDGTSASPVADFQGGADPSIFTTSLAVYGDASYFGADGNDGVGQELWKYDGFNAIRVTDVAGITGPTALVVYKDSLYFQASEGDSNYKLWKYAGSSTSLVTNILNQSEYFYNWSPVIYNNELYFPDDGNDGAGIELWKYDGTIASRVADILSGSESSSPANLTVYNGALYFNGNQGGTGGRILWKFDGVNPSRVIDRWSGPARSYPEYLTVYNNALYFAADNGEGAGNELWKYDGTDVSLVADIRRGLDSSSPKYLTVYNGALYFSADGGDGAGTELWAYISP